MEAILDEILTLVKKKMREQGGYDHAAYKAYVEETIDYFIEKGKLSEEDNLKFLKDRLMEMWENVRDKIGNIK